MHIKRIVAIQEGKTTRDGREIRGKGEKQNHIRKTVGQICRGEMKRDF